MKFNEWNKFEKGTWCDEVNVRDFISKNYTPYLEDKSFLEGTTEKTKTLWEDVLELYKKERQNGGVLDIDTKTVSNIVSHDAGYINEKLEQIVGIQTDTPLKRSIMPEGGIRIVEKSCAAYGKQVDQNVKDIFTNYRRTHNEGVYTAYTDEIKNARNSNIITGLPDGYGRGRIIGDYRRVALYGVDLLINDKKQALLDLDINSILEDTIRAREEIFDQIKALEQLKIMASKYKFDISKPAKTAKEAVQWTYFAYLAATKEQNGAAMSLGRVSTFFDIYFERDIKNQVITELEAQEIIDHFVMKLRLIRFLRTPEYDELFSGDPVWVTEAIGGMNIDGRTLVTKTSFRMLHTLNTLGAAPEPNLTVLWSKNLPKGFKDFCSELSIKTSSIQYENDDLMRECLGDDYGIACCVSAMKLGKQMQFFGARCNIAKALLYAINGGKDEITKLQVGPCFEPITSEYLDYEQTLQKLDLMLEWVARTYINALNIIHYMHDKYNYEKLEMALHDENILRTMACGIAGLSVVADSLSAIRYAKVKIIRDENNLAIDYEIKGDFPKYGNDDDRVDEISINITKMFMKHLRKQKTYRNSKPTLSILTIASNIVYGKNTGNTPDGRRAGEPFAPGANPLHGRDTNGALAAMNTISKLPYLDAEDGISFTFSILPSTLGSEKEDKINNLNALLDGYFLKGGHHINVNVFDRELLKDAMEHPENYPQLTIRVSGYAVKFIRLTKEQQLDVINRTIYERI